MRIIIFIFNCLLNINSNNEFENIQITMDGFSEILSELKTEIQSLKKNDNGESALKIDLLDKIVLTIDESKNIQQRNYRLIVQQ